jgi:hypothetical protein
MGIPDQLKQHYFLNYKLQHGVCSRAVFKYTKNQYISQSTNEKFSAEHPSATESGS